MARAGHPVRYELVILTIPRSPKTKHPIAKLRELEALDTKLMNDLLVLVALIKLQEHLLSTSLGNE